MESSGLPPWTCLSSLIFLLLGCGLPLPGAQGQEFFLRVEPQNPVFPAGGSLLVNCSTDCPDPKPIFLETSLSKESAGSGLGWAAFQLSNVTGDSQIFCSVFCNGSQITGSSDITVYRFPERVELQPLPPWQPVGENLTLRCLVEGGAPRAHLAVVLVRGEEELSRQPAIGEPAEVTATVLAGRGDHGANFSCRTELDLRSQGLELFQNTSAPRQLRTFALPMTPLHLKAPRLLEVGTSGQVQCKLDGLFPASEAQVQLVLGYQMLVPEVRSHGDSLMATAIVTAHTDQEGVQEVECNVTLADQSLKARANLTVFNFLGPRVNFSEPSVSEGSMVTVICTAGPQVQVMLDGVWAAAPGQPAQLQLNATESDDGRRFFCQATLEVDGETMHKNESAQLRVLYGPMIDEAKCPQRLKWKDKTTHTLHCQARGNPVPQLQCFQQGSMREVPVGIPFIVKLSHNGIYHCQAASPRGTYTHVVVMDVQDRRPVTASIIIGVLAAVGVIIIAVALKYAFRMQKRSGSYYVKQETTSLPLRNMQPNEAREEESS